MRRRVPGPYQDTQLRVELYHRAPERAGHDLSTRRTRASGHIYIGKTSKTAREEFYPQ